jgi:hypothetical protein
MKKGRFLIALYLSAALKHFGGSASHSSWDLKSMRTMQAAHTHGVVRGVCGGGEGNSRTRCCQPPLLNTINTNNSSSCYS